MKDKNEIVIFQTGEKSIEISLEKETIWLSLNQIAELFYVKKAAISKHLKNIYQSGELIRETTVSKKETLQIEGNRKVKRNITYYNLDAIISVGYRVNSKKATMFRIWATTVLKKYLINGYVINEKKITENKLKELDAAIKFIKNSINTPSLTSKEVKGLLEIIEKYTNTWKWIEEFDSGKIKLKTTGSERKRIDYKTAKQAINKLKNYLIKKKEASYIFGEERDSGLFKSALNTICQTFEKKELYPSLEEKAANLLYLIIKNHPFVDGNKRIGALLFLMFLYENIGFDELIKRFNNNTLTAVCYLVATSGPSQKTQLVNLITQMISGEGIQ